MGNIIVEEISEIPQWIKLTVIWWSANQISDNDFTNNVGISIKT